MTLFVALYLLTLPVLLVLVALVVRDIQDGRRRKFRRIQFGVPEHYPWKEPISTPTLPEWTGEVPKIEPPRAPEVTAYVRLVPHPTDYRKFIRVVEGAPEDPFDPYVPDSPGRAPKPPPVRDVAPPTRGMQ